MRPYRHLLLTRFNIMTEFAPAPQRLEDWWLRSRLEPFRRYCAPSVAAQTSPVPWLVFCDAASPAWFKEEIESTPGARAVYLSGPGTPQALADAVQATGLVDAPHLITSRVDSDDALARTFLETVQESFAGQRRTFVELPVGIQSLRGGLYTRVWRSNPFVSLIEQVEPGSTPETVWCISHAQVLATQPTVTLWRRPQWMQILHESNNESVLGGGAIPRAGSRPAAFACQWDEGPADPFPVRVRIAGRAARERIGRIARRTLGRSR